MFPIKHLHPSQIASHKKYDSISWQPSGLLELYESNFINPNCHSSNKETFDKLEDKISVLALLVKFKYARHCGDRAKQNEVLENLQLLFQNKPGFYDCLALVKNSSRIFRVALPNTFKSCILEVINNKNFLDFAQFLIALTPQEFNFIRTIAPLQFDDKSEEFVQKKRSEYKKYLSKWAPSGIHLEDKKKIYEIFYQGADVNQADDHGKTFLLSSVEKGHQNAVKLLLRRFDIDVNKSDNQGRTPLLIAVQKENEQVVELLLTHYSININKPDSTGQTPLQIAIKKGYTKITQRLLQHNDISASENIREKNLLHLAVEKGHTEIVKLLITRKDTDVVKLNGSGFTPLELAEKNKHIEIIDLLEKQIEANGKEELDREDQIKLNTILGIVLPKGVHLELLEPYLYNRNLDIYHIYEEIDIRSDASLLELIFNRKNIKLIELAFQYGKIKLHKKMRGEETFTDFLIFNCCFEWEFEFVKEIFDLILTDPKININERNRYRKSLLMELAPRSCREKNSKIFFSMLLKHPNIDVNIQDYYSGCTILHYFASHEKSPIETLLAHPKIDVTLRNQYGETPLDVAKRVNNNKAEQLISEKLSEKQRTAKSKSAAKVYLEQHFSQSLNPTQTALKSGTRRPFRTNQTEDIFDIIESYWGEDELLP